MLADNLATHLQNLYIVCGTAIPVLFVALAVQVPSTRAPALPINLGAYVMVLGQIAALAALVFDWTSVVAEVVTIAGVLVGVVVVTATIPRERDRN